MKRVNFDSLAMGQSFNCNGEWYRKTAPLISVSVETGELLYDARLIPNFVSVPAPLVDWDEAVRRNRHEN